jgi:hypothetical protein
VTELTELRHWTPSDENRWDIEAERVGPPPREARRYHPPTSPVMRSASLVIGAAAAVMAAWIAISLANGAPVALPIFGLGAVIGFGVLVLFGPRLLAETPRPSLEAEEEVALARCGVVTVARVETVEYGRKRARVGYRDGSDIDTSRGVARAAFELSDGGTGYVDVPFAGAGGSLKVGDPVTVLYDPSRPAECMAVRAMIDVEFPVIQGSAGLLRE